MQQINSHGLISAVETFTSQPRRPRTTAKAFADSACYQLQITRMGSVPHARIKLCSQKSVNLEQTRISIALRQIHGNTSFASRVPSCRGTTSLQPDAPPKLC